MFEVELLHFKTQFFDYFSTQPQAAFHKGEWHQNSKALFFNTNRIEFSIVKSLRPILGHYRKKNIKLENACYYLGDEIKCHTFEKKYELWSST